MALYGCFFIVFFFFTVVTSSKHNKVKDKKRSAVNKTRGNIAGLLFGAAHL